MQFYLGIIITLLISIVISFNTFAQNAQVITQEKNLGIIHLLSYSPDGKYIASANEKDFDIKIWDIQSEKLIGTLIKHESSIQSLNFSVSGKKITTLDNKGNLYVWNLENWQVQDSIKAKENAECSFFINDSEICVVNAKSISTLKLSNQASSEILKLDGEFNSAAQDATVLTVTDNKNNVYTIDLNSKGVLSKISLSDDVAIAKSNKTHAISVSKSGKAIYSKLNSTSPISEINIGNHKVYDINLNKNLIAASGHNSKIEIWDIKSKKLKATLHDEENNDPIRQLVFNPNGDVVAASGYKKFLFDKVYSKNNFIQVWQWELNTYKTLKGEVSAIEAFTFNPVVNALYVLKNDQLDIWNLNSGERYGTLELHERKIEVKDRAKDNFTNKKERFSNNAKNKAKRGINLDGGRLNKLKQIASGDLSSVKDEVVNTASNKSKEGLNILKQEAKLNGKAMFSRFGFQKDKIFVSPKGNYLFTILKNDEIRYYHLKDGIPEYVDYIKTGQKEFYDVLVSDDEEYLVVGGSGETPVSIISLINPEENYQLAVAESEDLKNNGLFQTASAMAHSIDGKFLVALFNNGRLVVWETSYWSKVADFNPKLTVTRKPYVGFSKDGKKIFVNTGAGVFAYNFSLEGNVDSYNLGFENPKIEGFPVMVHRPLDYVISVDEDAVKFLNIIENTRTSTENIPHRIITDIKVNNYGYVGIALKTGSLKIIDPTTGKERFMMVNHEDNAIFKTPENYYKMTKEGSELVTFRVRNKSYPFEQFDAKYNRPDIVLKAMNSEDASTIDLYEKAYEKRLKKLGFDKNNLGDLSSLPEVSILNLAKFPRYTDQDKITFSIQAEDDKYGLKALKVWIDDVPIYGRNGISINGKALQKEITLNLISGENKIQVAVVNTKGVESLKETMYSTSSKEVESNLYLISIGTSKYADDNYSLKYAAKDAEDLIAVFENNPKSYNKVFTKTILNDASTKENIKALDDFIANAKVNDVVIIFVAGHGLLDANYDYYYGTHDVNFSKPSERGLSYTVLENLMDGIRPLKKIIIMDTCHSGEVEEEDILAETTEQTVEDNVMFRAVGPAMSVVEGVSPTKMMKELFTDLRKGTGTTVISSAGGAEFAMESSEYKNGLFTYALLLGLRTGKADLNNDGKVMLTELQIYVTDLVVKLSHGNQTPNTRIQNKTLDYTVW